MRLFWFKFIDAGRNTFGYIGHVTRKCHTSLSLSLSQFFFLAIKCTTLRDGEEKQTEGKGQSGFKEVTKPKCVGKIIEEKEI